jgi:predicted ester cyclase
MKQLSLTVLTAFVFSLIACNTATTPTPAQAVDSAAQRNLAANNAVNKAIESGDVSNLGDYIASDAIDHSGDHGDVIGIDSIKKALAPLHKMATNDLKMEVIKELADSEYVFQWVRTTGTAANKDMGVAIGSKFNVTMISVSKFKNGKATEHWEFMQPADMMKMMSQVGK